LGAGHSDLRESLNRLSHKVEEKQNEKDLHGHLHEQQKGA
jgi:hypothetical protein